MPSRNEPVHGQATICDLNQAYFALKPKPRGMANEIQKQADFGKALQTYAENAEGAYAENTTRAIKSDLRVFKTWCQESGASEFPATPETVAGFLSAMAEKRKPATLQRYMASIAHIHRAGAIDNPTDHETVRLTMRRIRRELGTRQKQAPGLNRPHIDRIIEAAGDELIDLRDKALLSMAYDTLCRRSELALMLVEDLALGEDGTALIRKSKTDQEGEGSTRYLAPDTVEHIRRWLEDAGIEKGPLFRSVRKGGNVGGPLAWSGTDPGAAVAVIFKKMADKAGVDLPVSGHSTRVGAAQDMTAAGFGITETMQSGGWKGPQMVGRYTENQRAKRGAAAKLAALQNRA